MNFLVGLVVFCCFMIIYNSIKKDLVYKDAYGDPDYIPTLIQIRFFIDGKTNESIKGIKYTIEGVYYVNRNAEYKDIIKFLENHASLFINEITLIKNDFINLYNDKPVLDNYDIIIN